MRAPILLILIGLLIFCESSLFARVIHVPGDRPTIQSGINVAVDGDTVMVAPGTYYEHDIDFLGKAITVMGKDPEDSVTVASTIVDGDSLGSVFVFQSGENRFSVLSGLTITHGFSDLGGGVTCNGASPVISRNVITSNVVTGSDPIGHGGGIYLIESNSILADNIIVSNTAGDRGGGLYAKNSIPTILNNVFRSNSADRQGGGMYIVSSSGTVVQNNLIVDNRAQSDGGGIYIYASYYSTAIISNTIVGNWVDHEGRGGGISCEIGMTITNCILWDNEPLQVDFFGVGEHNVTYSNVEGGLSGEGNIDADPLFMDPVNNDFHLQQDPPQPGIVNPCVDSGDPNSLMLEGSTRTDGIPDYDIIDMGYHYPLEWAENYPPDAHFELAPPDPDPKESVLFDASQSYDPDGVIVLYEWDWDNDGIYDESSTIPTMTHSWSSPDSYRVTLRVMDDDSAYGTETRDINVFTGIIFVPDDYQVIQEAIDVADNGDEIIVRPGQYYEDSEAIDFLGKAITVRGTNPEDSAVVASTVVDGRFTFHSGEGSSSVLSGLTITNRITVNRERGGGGIYCEGSSPVISHNIIVDNGTLDFGGGIYSVDGSPTITQNVITGNSSSEGGGGICCNGGSPTITYNIITGNNGSKYGGGIYTIYSDVTIVGNIITDNWCTYKWKSAGAGICSQYGGYLTITDNLIANNTVDNIGGGIFFGTSDSSIISNNTIVGNWAGPGGGGGIYFYYNNAVPIANCILWDNTPDQIHGNPAVTYSDVEGGFIGEGNIDTDPLFVDPDSTDYHLQEGSPCIDAGDPDSPNVPWGGWRRDMGAVEYDQGFYYNGYVIIWKPVELEPYSP